MATLTRPVEYPQPLLTNEALQRFVLQFIKDNPTGVKSSEVGRAIGVNDEKQWFSYGVLQHLVDQGLVEKSDQSLYFRA